MPDGNIGFVYIESKASGRLAPGADAFTDNQAFFIQALIEGRVTSIKSAGTNWEDIKSKVGDIKFSEMENNGLDLIGVDVIAYDLS